MATVSENAGIWLNQLNDHGYRLTRPLRVVVEVLANLSRAMTAVDIYTLAREQYPQIGLTTIYRSLEKLEEARLIERVHQPDGCHAYVAAVTGHHHLLLCRHCGQAQYFSGDNLDSLIEQVAQASGFTIQAHWLQFLGLCPNCQSS